MSFLSPVFMLGLAGAGIPVLIHILTRDRVHRVRFSTLRFFMSSSRTILRRRRVREMILLAMRMAACALLAVAFARPIAGEAPEETGEGTLEVRTARVVALDLSGSMGRPGLAETAAEKAGAALDPLSRATDAAGLVTFSDSVVVEVPLTRKLADVKSVLEECRPGHGGTNIPEALRQANELLRSVRARRKEIVLVSDLQRTGIQGFAGEWQLAPGVRLLVERVPGPEDPSNVAVVAADYPRSMVRDNSVRTVAVRVANYSDRKLAGVEVALAVGGREAGTQKVNLEAGGTAPVRFRHVFERSGDNPGTVTVRHDDASPEDNVFHFNARVIPRIKVLILNGRPSRRPQEDAAFFVKAALAPTEESPFTARTVDAVRAGPADVDGASVAVLADCATVPAGVRDALGELLRRGGGLLFLPGASVQPRAFNQAFGRLAPCKLRRQLTPRAYVSGGPVGSTKLTGRGVGAAAAGGAGPAVGGPALKEAALTKIDFDHPVFQAFQLPHHGDLGTARFHRYWEVTDSQLARVHARFDDGRPAILAREISGGVSMMMVFPADLAWSDLPRRAVFLPLVHQTARYLAVRTEQRTGYRVGEALPVGSTTLSGRRGPVGGDLSGGGEVRGPSGEAVALSEGQREVVAERPGIYTVLGPGGEAEFRFAVNRDFSEADPGVADADEIVAAVEPAGGDADDASSAGGGDPDRPEADLLNIWWYVMFALALLTMGELFVGNHTQRH